MRTSRYHWKFAKAWFALGFAEGYAESTADDFVKEFSEAFARAREEARELGLAFGLRDALRLVLEARRVEVPPAVAAHIAAERDPAALEAWLDRALTATTIDDLFAGN